MFALRLLPTASNSSDRYPEEVAFYDALAENESAVAAMGDERLVIVQELLTEMCANVTVD